MHDKYAQQHRIPLQYNQYTYGIQSQINYSNLYPTSSHINIMCAIMSVR